MTDGFKDHFSDRAAGYAAFRPTYPAALADYLASLVDRRDLAWDVGCGSGQLSTLLGDRFREVIATDASAEQIARATPHPAVRYVVAPAEQSPVESHSADLVTAAQAAHWFDLDAFYMEVGRVTRPRAIVCLVTYGITRVDGPVRPVVDRLYHETLRDWWPAERRHTENGYADFAFPFAELEAPEIEMRVSWSYEQLLGYIRTWSAVRAMERAEGDGATRRFAAELLDAWGDASTLDVFWPLALRVGRVTG